ncbi:MAG: magnesium transporter [Candidatus Magasanikbacteria bacterium]|nr:magnesium transporter [Candidatus Magasanikbacteria bacterium]
MFFFSTTINVPVEDKNDERVGKLKDIAIELTKGRKFPSIVGLLAQSRADKRDIYISADKVAAWSHDGLVLNVQIAEAESVKPADGLLFLGKGVVDRQIVDLGGIRVVRVNDLQFGPVHGQMCLLAIDVSAVGLLRRLGLKMPSGRLFKPRLLEWNNVHLIGDKLQLQTGRDELVKLHPADIANLVEKMNVKQGSLLLRSLDQATAAKVMEEIRPEIQKMLVRHLGAERAGSILERMSMDELVDLIQLLPRMESREILDKLPAQKDANRVKKILEYDENTAGGLMTVEFISAHLDTPISEVIEKIRRDSHQHHSIHFVYVTDDKRKYLGVASLRRLIIASPGQKIKEVMKRTKRTPVVNVEQSVAEVANVMTKYNLLSVAVVDNNRKLLGIVTVDDIMRCLMPKA